MSLFIDNVSLKSALSPLFTLYFSKKKTWDDLKQRIIKLMKENSQLQNIVKTNGITKD
jgi:hypothetical protein